MKYADLPQGLNELSRTVMSHAYGIHTALGPGLLESCYKECLYYELSKSKIPVVKEKVLPLVYKDIHLDMGYRLDLLVDNKLIIEIKAVDKLSEVHFAQTLTYLKLSGCRLGLLLNFNVVHLKDGIKRVIL